MEPNFTRDQTPPANGAKPVVPGAESSRELDREQAVQPKSSNQNPQGSVSAALGAVRAEAGGSFPSSHLSSSQSHFASSSGVPSSVRFPGEDGGRSLAEMAQRDLDAALQLLADRAQYITGASGAAIALRRSGRNDMLCRASTGPNAPELGALLSTEFGLSGESVRTRQALRCDDAERDARVNQEVCRQMGIASVVVMPVVNDDEVLGVFELFSGKANAFGARDVSAVQRLSEMVETAVRLAQATETLPERLKMQGPSIPEAPEDQVLDGELLADVVFQSPLPEEPILEEQDPVVKEVAEKAEVSAAGAEATKTEISAALKDSESVLRSAPEEIVEKTAAVPPAGTSTNEAAAVPSAEAAPAKKKLFWSAATSPVSDAEKADQADQSHVPPVLRNLRKCEVCGFPVSAGRVLCVECEEKRWRGQLKPKPSPRPAAAISVAAEKSGLAKLPTGGTEPKEDGASSGAEILAADVLTKEKLSPRESDAQPQLKADIKVATEPVVVGSAAPSTQLGSVESGIASAANAIPATPNAKDPSLDFVLSAGLEPSQSWLAANKYVIGVLLAVAVAVVVVFLLR